MFETEDFRKQLENAISSTAAQQGMTEYQTAITTYLQSLATVNEPVLMENEMKKAVGARRGIYDALESARALVSEAATYAQSEKRKVIQVVDVQKAYSAKFCKVWPFCRS
jgi:adenylosuccinate synthase